MSGIMSVNGEPDGEPLKMGGPGIDLFAGYAAAYAVVAALLQRERGGPEAQGQRIDLSMLDSAMVLMAPVIASYFFSGVPPRRTGNRGYRTVVTSDTYATSDGYIAIGANHQAQFEKLCEILQLSELPADPRFANHTGRIEHAAELQGLLVEAFKQRSGAHLEQALAAQQVPVSLVRSIPDIVSHPHMLQREIFQEAALPDGGGAARIVGAGFQFGREGPATPGPVPELGEHTEAILGELGYSEAEIARMRQEGAV
jgi:crotonobetainyl-CoA:carnitine CoA-transferase CaiB-like acyl-CoA transferase